MRKLEVVITGDSAQLERALMRGGASAESFGHKLEKMAKVAVLAAGAAGIGALAYGLDKSVKAAMEAEKSTVRLDQAMKNVGISSVKAAKQVDVAEASGRKLGFTNTQTKAALGSLITSTGDVSKSMRELSISQDLARFKGVDLEAATKALTMANAGSMRAIKQLGITIIPVTANVDALKNAHVKLTTEQGRAELAAAKLRDKQATIATVMDVVSQKVKGQAQAFAGTGAGAIQVFQANIEGLEESIGAKLLPVLTRAVSWINANWPQISQVVSQVAAVVGNVIGQMVSAVSGHWAELKSLGVSAFSGLKSAVEAFVAFMKTGLGQAIATGLASFLLLRAAIGNIAGAVKGANGAMSLMAKNPLLGGAALGLSVAIGLITSAFIRVKMEAASAQGQLSSLNDTVRNLLSSLDRLKSAEGSLDQAHINLARDQATLVTASERWHKTIAEGKTKTQEGLGTYLDYRQAIRNVKDDTLALHSATTNLNNVEAQRKQTLNVTTDSVLKALSGYKDLLRVVGVTDSWAKPIQSLKDFGNAVAHPIAAMQNLEKSFSKAKNVQDLATGLFKVADASEVAARKLAITDPAAARAALKLDRLTTAAGFLVNKLGRVPTHKEIVAEAKLLGQQGFNQHLDEVIARARAAGQKSHEGFLSGVAKTVADATTKVGGAIKSAANLVGQARSAGHSVGAGLSSGIASGIAVHAADSAAAAVVSNAIAAAKAAASIHSPSEKTRREIGVPLVQGIALGIQETAGSVASSLGAAGEGMGKSIFSGAGRGIQKAMDGLAATLGPNLRKIVHDAIVAAAAQVATDRGTLASALGSLGSNIVSASQAIGPAFGTAKTRRLTGKAAQEAAALAAKQQAEQLDQLTRGLSQAQSKLGADTAAGADQATIDADKQAIADAQAQLDDYKAQLQIAADQKAADEAQKRDRDNLEKQWAKLEKEIKAHPERAAKIRAQIDALLAKYGITPASVQGATDWNTAQTLFVQSLGDVVTGMQTLTAALDRLAALQGGGSSSGGAAGSGNMPHKAAGGYLPGSEGAGIPIMAHANEYVLRSSATRKIGLPALDYMNQTGRLPRFAGGGKVNPQTGRTDTPFGRASAMFANDYGEDKWQGPIAAALMGSLGSRPQIEAALRGTQVKTSNGTVGLRAGNFRGTNTFDTLFKQWQGMYPNVSWETFQGLSNIGYPGAVTRLPMGGQELGRLIALANTGVKRASDDLFKLTSGSIHSGLSAPSEMAAQYIPRNRDASGLQPGDGQYFPSPRASGKIPMQAVGGVFMSDGLIYGHRGETVTPAHMAPLGHGGVIHLNATLELDGEKVGRHSQTFLVDEKRFGRPGIDS